MAMKNISLCVMTALTTLVVESKVLTVKMTSREHWWGVCNSFGTKHPPPKCISICRNLNL